MKVVASTAASHMRLMGYLPVPSVVRVVVVPAEAIREGAVRPAAIVVQFRAGTSG